MTELSEEELLLNEFDKILKEHMETLDNSKGNYSTVDVKKWLQPMTI